MESGLQNTIICTHFCFQQVNTLNNLPWTKKSIMLLHLNAQYTADSAHIVELSLEAFPSWHINLYLPFQFNCVLEHPSPSEMSSLCLRRIRVNKWVYEVLSSFLNSFLRTTNLQWEILTVSIAIYPVALPLVGEVITCNFTEVFHHRLIYLLSI